ncbi:hypothetical protein HHK36_002274 [Tetracentron sinense]|uniref:Uncharacterized protein n=1 Tax=Tetracentron sinense TaxID=13715 RepID=A0A835DST8_TETSI|nr:hypothetical protein HHK36_002274 [Tetracentron sinense]
MEMAQKFQQQLKEVGSKLDNPPASKDAIIKLLKDIFRLIIGTFTGLGDISGPSFGRRVVILETLARYRSCVVMLDLDCDDLVDEMFNTFFAVASLRHKRSPKNSMEQGQKGISESKINADFSESESRGHSDSSNSDPIITSKVDDMNSDDSEGEEVERTEKSLTDGEESDKEEKSVSEGKWLDESQSSLTEESDKEEKSYSEGNQAEDAEKSPTESKESNGEEKSVSSNSGAAEDSDDEPLNMWKRRTGKAV